MRASRRIAFTVPAKGRQFFSIGLCSNGMLDPWILRPRLRTSINKRVMFATKSDTLDESDKIFNELKSLTTEIQKHDKLYYTPGLSPQITDEEYDALTQREAILCKRNPELLKRLEVESGLGSIVSRYGGRVGPIIKGDSLTDLISNRVTEENLLHLENAPMKSLDNAMSSTHVVEWLNRVRKLLLKSIDEEDKVNKTIQVLAEPKMDGLSLSLRYTLQDESGKRYELSWGATRGDGTKGENVSEAVRAIDMIPKTIVFSKCDSTRLPKVIEVRGEVVLPSSKFEELTENVRNDGSEPVSDDRVEEDAEEAKPEALLPKFCNARNAASGILMRRKSRAKMTEEEIVNTKILRSYLNFYAYSIAFSSDDDAIDGNFYSDGQEMRNLLNSLGFIVPNPFSSTSIVLDGEKEVSESECKVLFDYHEAVISNRNISIDGSDCYDFDVDGTVYKVSSVQDRLLLGGCHGE